MRTERKSALASIVRRVLEGAVHTEGAVGRPRESRKNGGAGCVGVGCRAHERAHRRLGQRKKVGDDVGFADPGDLRDPLRLEKVRMVIMRGVVDRRRL